MGTADWKEVLRSGGLPSVGMCGVLEPGVLGPLGGLFPFCYWCETGKSRCRRPLVFLLFLFCGGFILYSSIPGQSRLARLSLLYMLNVETFQASCDKSPA